MSLNGKWCVVVVMATVAIGQTPGTATAEPSQSNQQATPAAAPTPAPTAWSKHGFDFYLLGDVYGDINFNHPASGFNQLYNFDVRANTVHLNMAKFSLERAPGAIPIGFRLDLGVGNAFDIASATDPGPDRFKHVEQAYIEFKPASWKGVQLDFGKFVTSAGAEVIETNANWNYSRSILFAWAIPYYHMGLRATIPIGKTFTGGFQLVNGWNNVRDNNSGKTVGIIGNFAWKKVSWANNYYTGPEKTDTNEGFRNLYDTTLTLNPNDKVNVYLNFDYGTDKNIGTGRSKWVGFEAAARYQFTKRFAFAPRAGIFNDVDGFSTGTKQTLKEVTLTGEMKIRDYLMARLEFRRDNSDKPFFDRGADAGFAKAQSTVALGLIAFFGPKK